MPRVCYFTGKKTMHGHNAPRKGLPKKKGGAGQHVITRTKRTFKVNLVSVKLNINGTVKKVRVAARYLKSGKLNEMLVVGKSKD